MATAQILPFPAAPIDKSPLAFFVRVGSAHKKFANLYASGRMPATRVVVDASRVKFQSDFLKSLGEDGVEIVLDTEVAELSSPRKFLGPSRTSPWVKADFRRAFQPEDFSDEAVEQLSDKIAQFAVLNRVQTVLSPSHYLSDPTFGGWFEIDRRLCLSLRRALDRNGGSSIAIDYEIIVSAAELRDVALRGDIVSGLSELPAENVWVRASGLSGQIGPLQAKRLLDALDSFHNLGRPIVVDYLGGLAGLTTLAFGSASGVAHGIAERERFDARHWHLDPIERGESHEGFGPTVRIEIPGLGRTTTRKELELLAKAPGGRKLCSCPDRHCCPHGLEDMIRDPRSHAAFQAFKGIRLLEDVPPSRREEYLLSGPIAEAASKARQVAKLKPPTNFAVQQNLNADNFMRRLNAHTHQISSLATALERLHEQRHEGQRRAKSLARRAPIEKNQRESKK